MKNFLSIDGPLVRFSDKVLFSIWLVILWMITSIPIITIGASTSALYYVMLKVDREEEGHITRQFFSAFKSNFKKGTIIWLIMLFVGIFVIGYMYISGVSGYTIGKVMLVVNVVLLIWYFSIMQYIFAILAKYENTVKNYFKLSCYFASRYIIQTIILLALSIGVIFATNYAFILFPFAFTIKIMISSSIINDVFDKGIVKKKDKNNKEEKKVEQIEA